MERHSRRGASLIATLIVLVLAVVILAVAWNYRQSRLREMRQAESEAVEATGRSADETYAGVSVADWPRYEAFAFQVRAFRTRFDQGVNFSEYDQYLDLLYEHFGRLPEPADEDVEEPELKQAANRVLDACNWVKVRWNRRSGDDDPLIAKEIERARQEIEAFLRIYKRVGEELRSAEESRQRADGRRRLIWCESASVHS